MSVYADRVKETTTTVGTGTYSLGGAVAGFRTFIAGTSTGAVVTYCADDGVSSWEIGEGTVTAGTPDTLTRTTILSSSNAGSAVSWSAGSKSIFLNASASRLMFLNNGGTTLGADGKLIFSNYTSTDDHIQLNLAGVTAGYGIGVETNSTYYRSPSIHRWYYNSAANGGASGVGMSLTGTALTVGTLTETSSRDLKENIYPITYALDSVIKLNGVTYDRKDGSSINEAGLIAEDVEQVLPNLVQKDINGKIIGIHYTKLTAYLIESIKTLKQEVDALKTICNGNT